MSGFAIRHPYFIVVVCLILVLIGGTSLVRMPVDLFPPINLPEVVVATFYSRHAARGYRNRYHQPAGALLHAGQRRRSHGIALAAGRQHHQSLFSARHQLRRRCDRAFQPLAGGSEAPSARNASAGGAQVRRLQPSGLPGHAERPGAQPDATARYRAIRHSRPDRRREGRRDSAAVRRKVPPGDGVCRSLQAAFARIERDGCGRCGQQEQSDSAGRATSRSATTTTTFIPTRWSTRSTS